MTLLHYWLLSSILSVVLLHVACTVVPEYKLKDLTLERLNNTVLIALTPILQNVLQSTYCIVA